MIKKIPSDLEKFIEKYFNLEIHNEKVAAPYHMNSGGSFLKRPVFSGKANPWEIEKMANEVIDKDDLTENKIECIRKEMVQSHLGIDCSGFTYQLFDFWLKNIAKKGELKNYLPKISMLNFRKALSRKLKPQSSVSAHMFTNEPISKKIELKEIKPGDLIRTRGGKHVLFVTEVEYDNNSLPTKIRFVHSTNKYKRTGVRYEEIILDKSLSLSLSKWVNHDPLEPSNETYKGYRVLAENNGVFRMNLPLAM